jgi:hypothetical protein
MVPEQAGLRPATPVNREYSEKIMRRSYLSVLGLSLLLAACGGGSNRDDAGSPGSPGTPSNTPSTRYDLANRCFALQSVSTSQHAVRNGSGYTFSSPTAAGGEAFYMKPTALGEYLFHAKDKTLLSANGSTVGTVATAAPAANWIIDVTPPGGFTAKSETTGQSMAVDPATGNLVLTATAGEFKFVPTSGCTAYPEINTDIIGQTYKGRGIDKPVVGFAEVHAHQAMGSEMSDGKNPVGPSAGGVMYGQTIHRFGVPHALKDCADLHGPNGTLDPEALVLDMTPLTTHETQGWPTFTDWPARDSQLHQMMYYKWVERAWKAGLRIMVVEGTNIEALCQIAQINSSVRNPAAASMIDCKDMGVGVKQVRYLYQVQDYIDAQEGGPGKGWYRIVKDPFEARAVINEGKLAVIPGLEFSNIFECNVTFDPAGNETHGCDEASIDRQIDEVWELGVRELFPYHDVNSALGGTGIFNDLALNLVGFWGTRRFWETYDCPDGGEGETYFYNAGSRLQAIPGSGNDPLSSAVISLIQGPTPAYPADRRQCNARGLSNPDGSPKQDRYAQLGRYALQKLMDKKFVIDIDHAELSIKQDMINLGKAQTPAYPLISAHGGHGGISTQQARDMLAMGGLIYPAKPNGKGHKEFLDKLKPIWPAGRPLALGFGMDGNGLADLARPRGAGSAPVVYPFKLFEGPDWGSKYAGFAPLTVNMQTIPESGKFWHVDETGTAHFGMVADFIEEIRLEGGAEALDAFYNSAEAYLQMWEQIVCREPNMPSQCTH